MKFTFGKRIFRQIAVGLSIVILFSLSACFDLGAFEDTPGHKDYYDTFGEVEALFDGGSHKYDVEDSLFNDYSVNELGWEDEDDKVDVEDYVYIVVPFECEKRVQSLALFVRAGKDVTLTVNAFYFVNDTLAPKKIKYKTSPDTEIIIEKDENGNDVEREVPIEYDDPSETESIAYSEFSTVAGGWSSFMLQDFNQEGYTDGLLHTGQNGLLYIRINENSGQYPERETCSFDFIDLLVRAV